jgi:hypothetical protein
MSATIISGRQQPFSPGSALMLGADIGFAKTEVRLGPTAEVECGVQAVLSTSRQAAKVGLILPYNHRLFGKAAAMRAVCWALCGWLLWILIASIGCGGAAFCFGVTLVFYSPIWLPIIVYVASSEHISHKIAGRWAPLLFLGFTALGVSCLLYVLKQYFPLLFVDPEASMVPIRMTLVPTGSTVLLYCVKIFYDLRVTQSRDGNVR